jgi:hypothetical protein
LTQLEAMRKSQGEMLELEETFGMDRVFERAEGTLMVGERAHQAKAHGLEKANAESPRQTATPLTRQRGTPAIHQPQCINLIGLLDRRMEST